jgi:threonyl-tRNA synthetase
MVTPPPHVQHVSHQNLLPQTFWHSSAHVLGQVLELEFGVDLTIGPALEEGFYYDCYMGDKVRKQQQQSISVRNP